MRATAARETLRSRRGPGRDALVEVGGRDDLVDEAVALGPGDVAQGAREQQLRAPGLAHGRGQEVRAGVRVRQPDADLGRPEARTVVAMRRSQPAANSRAPPMQTPSMAASTGTGAPRVALVTRWKDRTGLAHVLGGGVDGGEEVVLAEEVLACAARNDAAHALVGAGRLLDAVGDRLDRVARPGVAIGLAVPGHHARRDRVR